MKKHFSRSAIWTAIQFVAFSFMILFGTDLWGQAPDRSGSIDLTNDSQNDRIYTATDDERLGVEDSDFTFEAWVYMTDNGNQNFTLFKLRTDDVAGDFDQTLALLYNGDPEKNADAWTIETQLVTDTNPLVPETWDLDYNRTDIAPTFLNQWRHVAVRFENRKVTLWIDGERVAYHVLSNGGDGWMFNDYGDKRTLMVVGGDSYLGNYGGGTFYVGEVRLWKTGLSSTRIAKYFDEEVNSTHPNWDDLLRYYHGNEATGTADNRRFTDRSPLAAGPDDTDARGNESRIGLSTQQTPHVKPPSFEDLNLTFTASDCELDEVTLTWTDFKDGDYSTNTIPYYEIVRNSEVIYEAGAGTAVDDGLAPGASTTYTLRTYWEIGNSRIHSDDQLISDIGSRVEQYAKVTDFTASRDNCDRSIDLTWTWTGDDPPLWHLQRAGNPEFTSSLLEWNLSGDTRSFNFQFEPDEVDIYYRIIAYGEGANGCDVSGEYSDPSVGYTSRPPKAPVNLAVVVDDVNNELDISWEDPADSRADGYILRRERTDGSDPLEFVIDDIATTSYSDANLEICTTYRYKIGATNECSTEGVFSDITQTGLLGQDLSDVISGVTASKGYFGDAVRVEWDINGSLSQVDRFRVERTIADENNYSLIRFVDNDLIMEDATASAGSFYNYRVTGEAQCNDATVYTNEEVDLGFRQPFGIANGHVEYEGGNPVEDVVVNIERQDGANLGKSVFLDGTDAYIAIEDFNYSGADYTEVTVEAWIKTSESRSQIIASYDVTEYWRLAVNNQHQTKAGLLYWGVNTDNGLLELYSGMRVDDGKWHHVAGVFDNGESRMYVDGELVASESKGATFGSEIYGRYGFIGVGSETSVFDGNQLPKQYFEGHIDEVRIWSRAKTDEELAADHGRVISNEQSGLEIYYRMDEGVRNYVYDASKTGENFNMRDGLLQEGAGFSDDIPTAMQLGIKGITDEFGDYSADYVPYNGSGDIFRVTPAFGQHEFSPSSRSIYLGDGETVQNDLNFTDISFFTVSGKVTYRGTNVPVQGVTILVDGEASIGPDNKVIRTDAEGDYEIIVPIGNHFLSVEKDGHVFNEGFFPPLDDFGTVTFFEFTEDIPILNFEDDTKITVAGRVVGGNRETNKTPGFRKSVNNVGTAELTFSLQNAAYELPDVTVTTDSRSGEYEVELIPEQFIIGDIQTSGDYFIDAEDIAALDVRNSLIPTTLYDSTFTYEIEGADTLSIELAEVDSFTYHHQLNFTIQETPQIMVFNADSTDFVGDQQLTYVDQATGEPLKLDLSQNNPFAYPFFQLGHEYGVSVYLVESYRNPDHPDGALVDLVPVEDAEVTIIDNIGLDPTNGNTGKTDRRGHFGYQFKAGAPSFATSGETSFTKTFEVSAEVNGVGVTWREGDLFRAYVLGSQPLEGTGFVTYAPDQVDFVLRDPPGTHSYAYLEQGSSYSMAEGWSLFEGTNTGLDHINDKALDFQSGGGLAGPVFQVENENITELGMTLTRGYDADGKYTESYKFNERIETSSDPEDVGTDADLFIGKSVNVFISKTKNLRLVDRAYAESNNLECFPEEGSDVVLAVLDGITIDDHGKPTYFMYSHRFIVEELIPELLVIRDDLLANSKYESHFDHSDRYYGLNNDDNSLDELKVEILATDPDADVSNLSYTFSPPEPEMDSVEFINDQITNWVNYLAVNEAAKANATLETNISLDGSGGAYSAEVTQNYRTEFNSKTTRSTRLTWNAGFGLLTNGAGIRIRNTFDLTAEIGTSSNESIDHNMTFGYVIDERDEGDYYSIDVKKIDGIGLYDREQFAEYVPSKDDFIDSQLETLKLAGIGFGAATGLKILINRLVLKYALKRGNTFIATADFAVDAGFFFFETYHIGQLALSSFDKQDGIDENLDITGFKISSPIFGVRGGASRCPYEGEEISSFYLDPTKPVGYTLNVATLRRERPTIDVEPAIQANVPEEEEAVFNLKLGNESETNSNLWYELSIDESTNPDGAVLLIDGLTPERQYLVNANEILEKTLTIEKGPSGVLEYDSIGIILHSVCQFNPESSQGVIADTVYVSARFLPECSEVAVGNFQDNWIINYADGDEISVKLDDYNVNLSTFEKIDFQYKTLSGTPIAVMTFFKDDQVPEYATYDGPKGLINGASEVTFTWDISSLNDGDYQIRARSHCSDGSVFESDYLTGTIDSSNPVVFGRPAPEDGVLSAEDDLKIRFSEELEAGFVKGFNIKVRSVLNGAEVSHATSVQFNGKDDEVDIDHVNFNGKSFTIEYWLKNEVQTTASEKTVFTFGSDTDRIAVTQDGDDLTFHVGNNTLTVDPSEHYTVVTPWDSWHHWAFVHDNANDQIKIYLDDELLGLKSNVAFAPSFEGVFTVGDGQLQGKVHELRIWEDERSLGEIVANMSATLVGNESGLFGYWPLDEGFGQLAIDKTSGRNATIHATWSLEPGGVSWDFDGTNHLTINSVNILADTETDFTVEFWFQGTNTGVTQTLMSNGLGDGTDVVIDPNSVLVIEARGDGTIHVLSNGFDFQGTATDFLDGAWHHLALVVDRSANARLFIDAEAQNQTSGDNFADFYGSRITFGARMSMPAPATTNYDQYFTGALDEIRFWNSARPAELISQYKNTKIERDEPGLVSYHPFETYEVVMGAYLMENTLVDQAEGDNLSAVSDAESSDLSDHFSDQKPPVRDVRGMQELSLDFAVNHDEIVIVPTVDPERIEGQVLEITVLSVQDLSGNKLLSPVTWTAFVQQNQLKWDQAGMELTKQLEDEMVITASFTNHGGTALNYSLENIPVWLSTQQASGVINPQEIIEVHFEVREALNIGTYEHGINLSSELGYEEKLLVDLRVFGDAPNWAVDESDFELSMSVLGRLVIEGVVSEDTYDQVGAFVGDEVRGVASPEYVQGVDAYQVFLTVHSRQEETIELRIYDASTGRIHENVTPDLAFEANGVLGTVLSPIDISADDRISRQIDLNAGWTWISLNLDDDNLASVDDIFSGVGSDGDVIKDQNNADQNTNGEAWSGPLTDAGGLTPEKMYKVRLTNAGQIKLKGAPFSTDDHGIDVNADWNYLGYLPQEQMTLEEALVSYSPTPGDLIKTETQFAMYVSAELGWIGSLAKTKPGQGYMLYTSGGGTLTYPERSALQSARFEELDIQPAELFPISPNDGGHNMSLIAEIQYTSPIGTDTEQVLVAFRGDDVRGYVQPIAVGEDQLYFLSIAAEEYQKLSFKLYDPDQDLYRELEGTVVYQADKIEGTVDRPKVLLLDSEASQPFELEVFPNPFEDQLYLDVTTTTSGPVTVRMIDLLGKEIYAETREAEAGRLRWRIGSQFLPSKKGVYILQVRSGQVLKHIKLTK